MTSFIQDNQAAGPSGTEFAAMWGRAGFEWDIALGLMYHWLTHRHILEWYEVLESQNLFAYKCGQI